MKSWIGGKGGLRRKNLTQILADARDETMARLRILRKQEEDDAVELPADGLDIAHSLEEVETDPG